MDVPGHLYPEMKWTYNFVEPLFIILLCNQRGFRLSSIVFIHGIAPISDIHEG